MTKPHLIIGDVHGCFKTLQALIAQRPDHKVILLGDLIDRGPNSRAVIEWVMKTGTPSVAGNHEDLALAFSGHTKLGFQSKCGEHYDYNIWLNNGGNKVIENYFGQPLPVDVLTWMSQLPPYIIVGPRDKQGRKLLVSHTGYGLGADTGHWLNVLWGRHPEDGDFPKDKYYRIFGHNREETPRITDNYAMIDTGAAYKGYGKLTGMVWPSKEIIQQDFID